MKLNYATIWSVPLDLNQRLRTPYALCGALHELSTDIADLKAQRSNLLIVRVHGLHLRLVGTAGVEPAMTESKSVALPLGYIPAYFRQQGTRRERRRN